MVATSPAVRELYHTIETLPEGVTGEIVNGQLHTHPRPSARHGYVASNLGGELVNPFSRGRGGPGGWWIIAEPEVHFTRDIELCVPDLAGWRRERMPALPGDQRFEVVPDWICEIASPSTASYDRDVKLPLYAQYGVRFAWLVDPIARTLEAFELDNGTWLAIGAFNSNTPFRVAPFAEILIHPPWD